MGEPVDRSKRVFGELGDFDSAFPDLEDVIVDWIEGESWSLPEKAKKGEYTEKVSLRDYGGLFRCSASLCVNGGYEVDRIVSDMIRNNEKVREDYVICIGYEKMPGPINKSCYNKLYYRITLKYKDKQDE